MRSTVLIVLCSLLLSSPLLAQQRISTDATEKEAVAQNVGGGIIKMDGRLDEPEWERAPAIGDFVQKEPTEGVQPTEPMNVRFLYDQTGLYVGARMSKGTDSPVQAAVGRRDRGEESEFILIALDTFRDRRTAYVFGVTASGVRLDRFHPVDDEGEFDEGYDPIWEARTVIAGAVWTAELWIPFTELRFSSAAEQEWGLNVHRFTPTLDEHDYWVVIPRTATAWASRFGVLTGIRDIAASRRFELLPYVAGASTVIGTGEGANPFDEGGNLQGRAGADLKFGLGPNLTVQATFNPDFGQVEADPAEVNLSGTETFFTEKRPFFTESLELLNMSTEPSTLGNNFYYSRRIGARPGGPATGEFVDYPATTTIIGAAKLTGRLRSGTSIGLQGAVTGEENAHVADLSPSSAIDTVRVAARTAYAVGRVQQEFGANQSTASLMTTFVNRDLAAGDALASLLPRRAMTAAGDTRLRFMGGEVELFGGAGVSYVQGDAAAVARVQRSAVHYAQRPDRDYAQYDPTRTSLPGYKAAVALQRIGGRHWLWSILDQWESPGFETNDAGRLSSADGHNLDADLRYRETAPNRVFRAYDIGIRHNNEWNYGGDRQNAVLESLSNQTWRNFWSSEASVTRSNRTLSGRLARGGPLVETPNGWTTELELQNRTASRTHWRGQVTFGTDEDGGSTKEFVGRLAFRPAPRWQLSIDPQFLRQIDTQQYVTTLDRDGPETYGKRYVFANVDRDTYSLQLRLTYAFKPDVTLDVYTEPFAASGRYSDQGELAIPATRVRREYGTDGTTAVPGPGGGLIVTDGSQTFRLSNNDFNVQSFRSSVVLRWEYRRGSILHFVWQQDRSANEPVGSRVGPADPFRSITTPGDNYFVIKSSFWLPIRAFN